MFDHFDISLFGLIKYDFISKKLHINNRCKNLLNFDDDENVDFEKLFIGDFEKFINSLKSDQISNNVWLNKNNDKVGLINISQFNETTNTVESLIIPDSSYEKENILKIENRKLKISEQLANQLTIKNEISEIHKQNLFNNSLQEIRNKSESIKNSKDINFIKCKSNEIFKLSDKILIFLENECKKINIRNEIFNIHEEVFKSIEELSADIYDKNIQFFVKIKNEIPLLIGDKEKLKQIISCLLENSYKYVEKGEIFINISINEETEKEINLIFKIADTGIGIPEDKLKNIFEFDVHDGGVNLIFVKKIIEKIGGVIKVSSKINKGTEFEFSLPFKKQKNEEKINLNKNVLIISDNKSGEILKYYLKDFNCKSRIINELNFFSEEFDIMFIDYIFIKNIKLINKFKKYAKKKIIICINDPSKINMNIDFGFSEYISKPISKAKLKSILKNL